MNLAEWKPLSDHEIDVLLEAQKSAYYKQLLARCLAEMRMLREQASERERMAAEEIAW